MDFLNPVNGSFDLRWSIIWRRSDYILSGGTMDQDKYTKFVLTVIAFSLFWIALNLSVIEFVLYDFYNGEMTKFLSEISNQTAEISSSINAFYSRVAEISSRIDEFSSRTDEVIDAIKKR